MMKKILVPIDGSDISLRAMNFAIELGKHFASEIVVLNVDIPYDLSRIKPAVKALIVTRPMMRTISFFSLLPFT